MYGPRLVAWHQPCSLNAVDAAWLASIGGEMKQLTMTLAFLITAAGASTLGAQGRGERKVPDIPT